MTNLILPTEALFVFQTLHQAGFECYLVGGAVRDLLITADDTNQQQMIKDFDFATNATPNQIKDLFPESFYENEFGTVSISHQELLQQMGLDPEVRLKELPELESDHVDGRVIDLTEATKIHESLTVNKSQGEQDTEKRKFFPNFEITTYRSQELYENFRHPDPAKLKWGETIEEDLQRRDFTINALALKVNNAILNKFDVEHSTFELSGQDYQIVDPHHGLQDLADHVVKTVGKPTIRFQEDALRMLRAIRFSVQLNMKIDAVTLEAIKTQADLIKHISWERIRDEFLKILASDYPKEGIELLDQTGLLKHILPELQAGKGVEQGGHHNTDVWTHSLDALQECPSQDPIVRLATLLHDISKPETYKVIDGKITFYNHEILGSRVASKIAKRFRLSKEQIQRLFTLVRYHMFHYQAYHTDAAVRRFMRKVGLENIDDILDLREGDRLGSGARKTSWRLEEMKERMIEQLNQPMEITDLAINGHDLMTEFGLKPGPVLGDILNQLLEEIFEKPELNERETLLKMVKKLLNKVNS